MGEMYEEAVRRMTLKDLEEALAALRAEGAEDDSPIIVEGEIAEDAWAEEGDLVQAGVESVKVEGRCEDGSPGVYLSIVGVSIG